MMAGSALHAAANRSEAKCCRRHWLGLGLSLLSLCAFERLACDRVGRGSALRLAVRRNPAWTAGFSGFRSFDWLHALAT
jgi:hypothetical protein